MGFLPALAKQQMVPKSQRWPAQTCRRGLGGVTVIQSSIKRLAEGGKSGRVLLLQARGDRLGQGAVLHRVQAVCSDAEPGGGAESLGFQPESDQVFHAVELHVLGEVREGHGVAQDLRQRLRQA